MSHQSAHRTAPRRAAALAFAGSCLLAAPGVAHGAPEIQDLTSPGAEITATASAATDLCDPAAKLATPWVPGSVAKPPLPGTAADGEGPFIGDAIVIDQDSDVHVRPLTKTPKAVERTRKLGFSYRAPGAKQLRVWVVMPQQVAKVAYPDLEVGPEAVRLGVRTVKHPRRQGGRIRIPLDHAAAYGVGPFLRVQLTLCAAATAASGKVTITARAATLQAF